MQETNCLVDLKQLARLKHYNRELMSDTRFKFPSERSRLKVPKLCYGSFTLSDTDSGTDSDSDPCPVKK